MQRDHSTRSGRALRALAGRLLPALACLAALSPAALPAAAADGSPTPGTLDAWRTPGAHALVGARIVVAPGQVVESGTLVVRDGIVEAVGPDVATPADARVWDVEGKTLYPGLIDSFVLVEMPEPADDAPGLDGVHPNGNVHPERDVTFHAFDEGVYKRLRGAGFTTAVLVPKQGILRGRSAAVSLGDGALQHTLLARDVAQNVRLTSGFGGGYPSSTMGAVALVRQTFTDARWQADARRAWSADPAQARPAWDASLEALEAAARGDQKVVLEASDLTDLLRLADLAEELGLDATLVATGDEYRRLEAVRAAGLDLILPLDLPDAPKVGDEDDLKTGLEELRHWKSAPENPKHLLDAGVSFALTSHALTDPKKLHAHLATAIARGLPADAALAALTTVPARRLGMERTLGTLERGKAANLLVVDGDLFAEKTKILEVWVDGVRYSQKDLKPPTVDPLGTWEMTIVAGDFRLPATVTLTGTVDALGGTIASPQGNLPVSSADVSGDTVYVETDLAAVGGQGTISFTMKIDGDSVTGSGSSPDGDFELEGRRTAKPDPEVIR